ncbi:MAG: phenylalanine--tRNA ligase subunit alpha, partial [Methanomassiliicoccales archaeon]
LSGKGTVDEIFEASDFGQTVEVMNAASWLQSKGLVDLRESARKRYSIKRPSLAEGPLPERTALQELAEMGGSAPLEDLQAAMDKRMASIAIGWLKRKGLADIHRGDYGKVISLTSAGERALEETMDDEALLQRLAQGDLYEDQVDPEVMQKLLTRQDFVDEKLAVTRTIELTDLGREILDMGVELTEEVAQLTPELIQSGRWREISFRKYDIRTFAPSRFPGKKHPLSRIADEVRRIFIQMGFTEIDEEYVQPAFWNMDTLFIPQDHPARELQDTFYLSRPSELDLEEKEIVDIIKSVHEDGWETGSTGWGYEWDVEMAKKALLRTHTTVNTIKHLWRNPEPPVKVFSLSRVFRNEAIDSTHLPEFLQIEGIIMEEDANLDILVAVLKDFYRMMGFEDVRVRPGYFPYTEPSLEVEVYFNGAWMELGGSGIFRPEVTRPFGVEHPVLAWGLGFERLAMLRWNLKDIRELYISDLDMLRESPLF